jgi:hypothetical protein
LLCYSLKERPRVIFVGGLTEDGGLGRVMNPDEDEEYQFYYYLGGILLGLAVAVIIVITKGGL